MDEYVAIDTEQTDALWTNHALTLLQLGGVNLLGLVTCEARYLIDVVVTDGKDAARDVAQAEKVEPLTVGLLEAIGLYVSLCD